MRTDYLFHEPQAEARRVHRRRIDEESARARFEQPWGEIRGQTPFLAARDIETPEIVVCPRFDRAPSDSSCARFSEERPTAVTSFPAAISSGTARAPTTPVAPVTKIRFGTVYASALR
jgi:hypothetical protein